MSIAEWVVSAALAAFITALFFFLPSNEDRCLQEASLMGLEGKYVLMQGCFARIDQTRWARIERIRIDGGKVSVEQAQ